MKGDLSEVFRRLIASTGPIPLSHYMAEANARYYSSRDPLGGAGDFITAPEVSQMFGELVGLWLADMWDRAGRPAPVHYVELGPGRGTLASDALRAMRSAGLVPQVHLVEASPVLRQAQAKAVPQAQFHHDLASVPDDAPLLLVANEFLDALPVRQLVKTSGGWRERMVIAEDEGFACAAGSKPMDAAVPDDRRDAELGAILETSPASAAIVQEVSARLAKQGGAALFIDYGYAEPRFGSSFQAVRAHEKVDPFRNPGTADLTALVDFSAMEEVAKASGAKAFGTITQGQFLLGLGIAARAQALAQKAPHQLRDIGAALRRLVDPDEMGDLFKVMALSHPDWPQGAVF